MSDSAQSPSQHDSQPQSVVGDRELIRRWIDKGDQEAAGAIYELYVDRLLRAVRNRMKDTARMSADSVVQSAFESFLRRARDHQFTFDNDEALWKVQVTITLNKFRMRLRKKSGTEIGANAELWESRDPGPDEVAAYMEMRHELFCRWDDRERKYIGLREEGLNQIEIANEMGITTRQVRRIARTAELKADLFLRSNSVTDNADLSPNSSDPEPTNPTPTNTFTDEPRK